jgi:hypothetical protein
MDDPVPRLTCLVCGEAGTGDGGILFFGTGEWAGMTKLIRCSKCRPRDGSVPGVIPRLPAKA